MRRTPVLPCIPNNEIPPPPQHFHTHTHHSYVCFIRVRMYIDKIEARIPDTVSKQPTKRQRSSDRKTRSKNSRDNPLHMLIPTRVDTHTSQDLIAQQHVYKAISI